MRGQSGSPHRWFTGEDATTSTSAGSRRVFSASVPIVVFPSPASAACWTSSDVPSPPPRLLSGVYVVVRFCRPQGVGVLRSSWTTTMAADLGGSQRYTTIVGEIPDVSDVAGWAAAWTREEEHEWTQRTRAHTLFRDLDGGTPGNAFLKQMRLLPDALVPMAEDRSTGIMVVRRPSEVGYVRTYGQRRTHMVGSSYTAASWDLVVMSPAFLEIPLDYPTHTSITASRNHRTGSCPFLVGWHQAEFTSCPQPRRAQYYARVPPWWSSVEVPYGVMVELPPVREYTSGALLDRDDLAV